jgi:hypothetical protein
VIIFQLPEFCSVGRPAKPIKIIKEIAEKSTGAGFTGEQYFIIRLNSTLHKDEAAQRERLSLAILALLTAVSSPAWAMSFVTERVSVSSNGDQGNDCLRPGLGDGPAFVSPLVGK